MIFFLAVLLSTADPSIAAIVEPAGGTVGFTAVELATGRTLGLNQDRPFPMQSVFKLPIAIEVLHQVDAGKIALDLEIVLVADEGITIRFSERRCRQARGTTRPRPRPW